MITLSTLCERKPSREELTGTAYDHQRQVRTYADPQQGPFPVKTDDEH
jgi:hypothetical protein